MQKPSCAVSSRNSPSSPRSWISSVHTGCAWSRCTGCVTRDQLPGRRRSVTVSKAEASPVRTVPTAVILLIGMAAAVIVLGGLRAATFIVGPVFLALVLTIVVYPAQEWVTNRGLPTWVSLVTGFVCV